MRGYNYQNSVDYAIQGFFMAMEFLGFDCKVEEKEIQEVNIDEYYRNK